MKQHAYPTLLERLYTWSLQLYPPAFREAYRDPMLQALRDALHDNAIHRPWLLAVILIDLIASACKENLRMLRQEFTKRTIIFQALLLAAVCSMFAFAMFATVQHALRSGANDPQLQMAGDAVAQLEQGGDAASIVGPNQVDMARSLSPFLIVFDRNGNPVASAAKLNGRAPKPPYGVFRHASEHQLNILTWQPQRGVRIAAVIQPYTGPHAGFVLAGRSLRVVEERADTTLQMVALAWLGMIAFVILATIFFARLMKPESRFGI